MITIEPLAVSVEEAARLIGVDVEWFQHQFVAAGRVKAMECGARLIVSVADLRAAFSEFVDERHDAERK